MDKQNLSDIDDLLDEQIAKFPTGGEVAKAKKHLPIKMVNTDIEFLYRNGVNTGLMVCGICTIDGIYYGALFDHTTMKGHVEEIQLTIGKTSIKQTMIVQDSMEWNIIVDFFNRANVWELKRILNWVWSVKNGLTSSSKNWIDKLNKDIHGSPLTREELASASQDVISRSTS